MKIKIYKLYFTSPLHLSLGKDQFDKSAKTLHSDTLKSAIISCAALLGHPQETLNRLNDALVLSSAFPFFKGEYFFPKPIAKIFSIAGIDEAKQGKPLKKISFIGKSYFEKLLMGIPTTIHENHTWANGEYVSEHPNILATKPKKIIHSSVNQRVFIQPDHIADAMPFYSDRLFFEEGAGLFFMLQNQDEELNLMITGIMKFLGDNGIGTDRTIGNGFFKMEEDMLELSTPNEASHQINLSLFCPTKSDLEDNLLDESTWQITKRGGFLAGAAREQNIALRKRSIYMFLEGSVFSKKSLEGKYVNLQPNIGTVKHQVWREGRAIFIPFQPLN
jgi:CRISPR-associated protein Csm4